MCSGGECGCADPLPSAAGAASEPDAKADGSGGTAQRRIRNSRWVPGSFWAGCSGSELRAIIAYQGLRWHDSVCRGF